MTERYGDPDQLLELLLRIRRGDLALISAGPNLIKTISGARTDFQVFEPSIRAAYISDGDL